MKAFEDELYELIKNIEFTNRRDDFQTQLRRDARDIRSSNNITVFADKSTNLYSIPKDEYEKLLRDNITQTYKKTHPATKDGIDREAKQIAHDLNLGDRMERYADKQAFVTLKDHKDNFRANPKCRLINPAKSEMGHVSKSFLESAVREVSEKTQLNQWRDTSTVINWFTNIKNKKQHRFIKFDICEFYPSISEALLEKAIAFAQAYTSITDQQVKIIKHSRKSLLFNKSDTWIKKEGDLFDVTMGSLDGAEVCELVGLYLLDKLSPITGKLNTGLYRDDGLCAINTCSPRRLDKLRKDITAMFKEEGLSITIEINLLATDFLDVTLDLFNNKYYPYRKPNNNQLYINAKSNHPEPIIKELPMMIARRLSDLSCSQDEFNKAKGPYKAALKESGLANNLEYKTSTKVKKRNRNVIWFNPPFNKAVSTNIGKIFLRMVKKHFTKQHHYYKILNIHTIKLSYSCMPNMERIIKQSNAKILDDTPHTNQGGCNCSKPEDCLLDGQCLTSCIVYNAEVSTAEKEFIYHGSTKNTWKE